MAVATHSSTTTGPAAHGASQAHTRVRHAPVTPGKVAMWLFLATEVMFFTGLIGSYIVLRAGSTHDAYSNLYPPTTPLKALENRHGVVIEAAGGNVAEVEHILHTEAGLTEEQAEIVIHQAPDGLVSGLTAEKAAALAEKLKSAGAKVVDAPLKMHKWPVPYDGLINPLAINLTAFNTFVLICSSVTMVLSLSAIQDGKRGRGNFFLAATVLIGSFFLSIQVYEYYHLMVGHIYPAGISATGHFRPRVSLFASCFFTMTGFHGAHVTGGVVLLSVIFIRSFFFKAYTKEHYAPLELAGLYWHFVDLVWIILFTIVYLILKRPGLLVKVDAGPVPLSWRVPRMAETTKMAETEIAAEHAFEAHTPYLKVFAGLAVLTAIEYWYAAIFKDHFAILLLGLLLLAGVKAGMVGWYFMHLKFEGKWVYIMIVPAAILAVMLTMALCPDMVLKYETEENPGEDSVYVLPATELTGTILASQAERVLANGPCVIPGGRGSVRAG